VAKQFIDLSALSGDASDHSEIAKQDGTALTLTNHIRILYDDTIPSADLAAALQRGLERIVQLEG